MRRVLPSVARLALPLALALGAAGCANNAIFTLQMDLPPAPPATPPAVQSLLFLVVEGRPGMEDWTTDWQQWQAGGIGLDPVERTMTAVDFVASGDAIAKPLRVKIRFCISARCTLVEDGDAPEIRIELERVFYQGRYTEYPIAISSSPTGDQIQLPPSGMIVGPGGAVPKCAIHAPECIEGTPATSWCVGTEHYCER